MLSDTHVHTYYSFDSDMKMDSAVKKAAKLGLTSITFTDHLDYDFPGYGDTVCYDFDKYLAEIDMLKEKYEKKLNIKILKGAEAGLQPHVMEKTYEKLKGHEFDQLIGSTHVINGFDPYFKKYYGDAPKEEKYGEYLDAILANLEYYKDFDIFAHFDYVARYPLYEDKTFRYSEYKEKMDTILNFVAQNNMALEINTSTYARVSLDTAVLKRYKELGGELITLGSDAHSALKIGILFTEYSKIIKDCGFDYIFRYENRKPVAEKII